MPLLFMIRVTVIAAIRNVSVGTIVRFDGSNRVLRVRPVPDSAWSVAVSMIALRRQKERLVSGPGHRPPYWRTDCRRYSNRGNLRDVKNF